MCKWTLPTASLSFLWLYLQWTKDLIMKWLHFPYWCRWSYGIVLWEIFTYGMWSAVLIIFILTFAHMVCQCSSCWLPVHDMMRALEQLLLMLQTISHTGLASCRSHTLSRREPQPVLWIIYYLLERGQQDDPTRKLPPFIVSLKTGNNYGCPTLPHG